MPKVYDNYEEAARDYDQGNLDTYENINVRGKKTTAGRAKASSLLPEDMEVTEKLDDDKMGDILHEVSEKHPKDFPKVADNLRKLGEEFTYKKGFSVGIEDIEPIDGRDQLVEEAQKELEKVDPNDKGAVAGVGSKYVDKIGNLTSDKIKGKKNRFHDMVEAGSRGSMQQLQQMLATPTMLNDADNEPVPSIIENSYGEGLNMGDYWTTLYGARKGIIDRRLSQAKPGEISKFLIKTVNDQVISEDDCGTTDGVEKSLDNKSIVGRTLAKAVGSIAKRNQVLDNNLINKFRKNDYDKVKVRSPMTCEARKGVCKKCYGHDEFGGFPDIGDNVGVKAGQAAGEPISQLVMETFHSGGAVKGEEAGDVIEGLPRIDQLLSMPSSFDDEAVTAQETGKVKRIEERDTGGKDIVLEDQEGNEIQQFAPIDKSVEVDEGEEVQRADKLTSGIPNPDDLVDKVGIKETRKRLSDELKSAYSMFNIDDHVFETISRGTTDLIRVKDPAEESDLLPGDYASYSEVKARNEEKGKEIPVEQAEGKPAAREYNTQNRLIRPGDKIDKNDIDSLKSEGNNKVKVNEDPVTFRHQMAGINTINSYKPDWMTQIGFNRVKSSIEKGVSSGSESDIHGYDPIPAFAYGAEFGEGKLPGSY